MNRTLNVGWVIVMAACVLIVLAVYNGSDEDSNDYTPPAWQGVRIVENKDSSTIDVYIDGVLQKEEGDGADTRSDVAPGEYSSVLDEENGDREGEVDAGDSDEGATSAPGTSEETDSSDSDTTSTLE